MVEVTDGAILQLVSELQNLYRGAEKEVKQH